MAFRLRCGLIAFALVILIRASLCFAQTLGHGVSGTIVDQSGAVVADALVRLTGHDQSLAQQAVTDNDGQFSFTNVAPGSFILAVTSAGFATQTCSGVLRADENYVVPQIALTVATGFTEVQVGLTQTEVAEQEIKVEEKQRVLGMLPNFYVSYVANAAPLSSKQKFKLAWKMSIDPVTLGVVGIVAGYEQAQNHFSQYGQGAQGYGKRFGAGY